MHIVWGPNFSFLLQASTLKEAKRDDCSEQLKIQDVNQAWYFP